MAYPKPTLRERLVLPFKMFYWRFLWKPIDYDEAPKLKDGGIHSK